MVTIKLMALQLSTNLNHELLRLALAAHGLTGAEIEDLMPLDAVDRPPPMPDVAQLYPLRSAAAAQRRADASTLIDDVLGSGASNNWVVSGARTKSGRPLLANDPHLRLAAPAIWYLVHLALERPGAGGEQCGRRQPGGRAAGRARAQRHPGLGLHQHRVRRAGPLHREDQPGQPARIHDARGLASVRDR